jgi:hypothetical protein
MQLQLTRRISMSPTNTPIFIFGVLIGQRTSLRALAAGGFLLVSACSDQYEPGAPGSQPESSPVQRNAPVTADDPISLARAVPGFGGFYLDGGTPVVYLKSASQRGNVERALAPFFRAEGLAASQLRILPAKYDWAQLERWFTQASEAVLAERGGVFVDADEASNRVLVGVERGAAPRIRVLLARLGIPEDAVVIQETGLIHLMATLRSSVRPVVGGLQINFTQYLCTLGFNALRNTQRSFITTSHCTTIVGGAEGTIYYQPTKTLAPVAIGTEVSDPAYFQNSNGCPIRTRCRFSDAARARYASGISFSLGKIARTAGPNVSSDPTTNPRTITGSFSLTAEGNASVGQTVNKVGRTTGWTQGKVTNTCVNTTVGFTGTMLLCQTIVFADARPGDSGSPVFKGTTNVILTGLLWGGGTTSAGAYYVYSPISNIERELGLLTTF